MVSTVPTVRFVRCPKCLKVLAELPQIPLYKCGGCETILQTKVSLSSRETSSLASAASCSRNMSDSGYLDNGSANLGKQIRNALVESVMLEKTLAKSSKDSESSVENNFNEEFLGNGMKNFGDDDYYGESSEEKWESAVYEQNEINESILEQVKLIQEKKPEEVILEKTLNCLNQEMESYSDQRIPEAYDSLNSSDNLEQSTESLVYDITSEEDKINGEYRIGTTFRLRSITCHAYDGSASSSDEGWQDCVPQNDLLLSRRTFWNRKVFNSSDSITEATEGFMKNIANAGTVSVAHKHSIKSSMEKTPSAIAIGKVSSRNGVQAKEQDTSLASEDFHSVQNWMKSESAVSSRYSAKGDDVKLLKVDELSNELGGLFSRTVDGKESCFGINLTHFEGKFLSKYYRSSLIPFSRQHSTSCMHCHPGSICCHNGHCRPYPHNVSCHPFEASTDLHLHMKIHPPLDEQPQTLQPKGKRSQTLKRHCRPVSGGAPFVICYRCYKLLQLPADFLVSTKRVHKLCCGACSELLAYSFRPRTRFLMQTPVEAQHPPSEDGNNLNSALDEPIMVSQPKVFVGGDPISYSGEYVLSFSKSNSDKAEPFRHLTRNSEEEPSGRGASDSLHQVIGHASTRDAL